MQIESGLDGGQAAVPVQRHDRAEHAIGADWVFQTVLVQAAQQLVPRERDGDHGAHGRVGAQRAQRIIRIVRIVRTIRAGRQRLAAVAGECAAIRAVAAPPCVGGRVHAVVPRHVEHDLVQIDVTHEILELAVQNVLVGLPARLPRPRTGAVCSARRGQVAAALRRGGLGRLLLIRGIIHGAGQRMRRVAMVIAVLGVGLGPAQTGVAPARAFEGTQHPAHQIGDRGILFGHGLLEPDRVDVQRHPANARARPEAQRGHHQPGPQVVLGAQRGPVVVAQRHPRMLRIVVAAGRHHRGAGRGESDRGLSPGQIRAEVHVEAIRQPQPAQQRRQGPPVQPFGIREDVLAAPAPRGGDGVGIPFGQAARLVPRLIDQARHRVPSAAGGHGGRRRIGLALQGDQRRVGQQHPVDLRRLRARDRVLGGSQPEPRIAFEPCADVREAVEVALDLQRFQGGRELQPGIPGEEVVARIGRRVQAQRLRAVHGFEAGGLVEHLGLVHEVGEMVLQPGGAHAMGARVQGIAQAAPDRADRRLAVEPAEDVAGPEPDEQAVHLGQHVGREERDGDRVAVFQIEAHGRRQRGAHLFERVPVVGLEPRGEPGHAAGLVPADDAALDGVHDGAAALLRVVPQTRPVRQTQFALLAEHEPHVHAVRVHRRIGADEHAPLAVGERDLREVVAVGERAERERRPLRDGQLRPPELQAFGHTLEIGEDAPFDQRAERDGMFGERRDDVAAVACAAGRAKGGFERVDGGLLRAAAPNGCAEGTHQPPDRGRHADATIPAMWCVSGHASHSSNPTRHEADRIMGCILRSAARSSGHAPWRAPR